MDEFDTLASAMWNASAFGLQMTAAKPGLVFSPSLFFPQPSSLGGSVQTMLAGRRERKKQDMNANPKITYLTQVLICHRTGCACAWFHEKFCLKKQVVEFVVC